MLGELFTDAERAEQPTLQPCSALGATIVAIGRRDYTEITVVWPIVGQPVSSSMMYRELVWIHETMGLGIWRQHVGFKPVVTRQAQAPEGECSGGQFDSKVRDRRMPGAGLGLQPPASLPSAAV